MPPKIVTVAPSSGPGPTPRTPLGLSGLGAVGGPRGVGAGALRVILEFVTQYDAGAIKQLEADLARMQKLQNRAAADLEKQNKIISNAAGIRTRVENLRRQFTSAELTDLKRTQVLRASADAAERKTARQRLAEFRQVAARRGLTKGDTTFLINSERHILDAAVRTEKAKDKIVGINKRNNSALAQQAAIETVITEQFRLRALLGPRLLALATGAIGGIFGGAVVGLAFTALQGVLDEIGSTIQEIVDPAGAAAEELEAVAEAIEKLASDENLSNLEAARRLIAELDPGPTVTAALLAQAAALQAVREEQEKRQELLTAAGAVDEERQKRINAEIDLLFKEEAALKGIPEAIFFLGNASDFAAGRELYLEEATENVNAELNEQTRAAYAAAAADRELANAAAYAAVQQRIFGDAVDAASDMATQAIQDQIDALDEASHARDVAQERAMLDLEERLAMGQDVDPNSVSGQMKIAALNARIANLRGAGSEPDRSAVEALDERIKGLQRLSDEQERFNRLLDLQFKKSQIIRRQEGETIADFLQRRAQEQRHLLEEEADLQREGEIAVLEAEKEKLQAQLDRFEGGNQAAIEALEKEKRLEEIRLRRAKLNEDEITRARRKALEEQLKKTADYWELIRKFGDKARTEELIAAVGFARTMNELLAISGEISGAKLAANQLRAWLNSGLIAPAQRGAVLDILRALDAAARAYNSRLGSLLNQRVAPGYGDLRGGVTEGFQSGGVFALSNARSPFGQNVRFGEGGQEMMVALSNRVTNQLRGSRSGPVVGSINVQGTGDVRRDRYALRQIVREEVSRVLG